MAYLTIRIILFCTYFHGMSTRRYVIPSERITCGSYKTTCSIFLYVISRRCIFQAYLVTTLLSITFRLRNLFGSRVYPESLVVSNRYSSSIGKATSLWLLVKVDIVYNQVITAFYQTIRTYNCYKFSMISWV